jgi:hypothetical protein
MRPGGAAGSFIFTGAMSEINDFINYIPMARAIELMMNS